MHQGRCSATLLAAAVLLGGCSVRPGTTRQARSAPRAPSTVVTSQELAQVGHNGNLKDVLERIRPGWFESRGTTPLVSVDGSPPSDITTLQAIQIAEVRELRLERSTLSVGHASLAANGNVIRGDIIMVSTRVPGSRR